MASPLGLRRRPGRLVLVIFRVPLPLFRAGLGWVFGHAFLLLTHRGRASGRPYETALKVLSFDPRTREAIVFSAWPDSDWIRNIKASPALQVRIARQRFVSDQRFLSDDEATAVVAAYRDDHPWRIRLLSLLLGWGDLGSDQAIRRFVRTRPFVALHPAKGGTPPGTGR